MTGFSNAELRLFEPKEDISFWEWLPKNFILCSEFSEVIGPYPTELAPAFKGAAKWIDDPNIDEIASRKSTQIGFTTFVIGAILYKQWQRPRPAIYAMADQTTAEDMSVNRFGPCFENALCFQEIEIETDKSGTEIEGGGSVKMAWASSVAAFASISVSIYVADEVTKPGYNLKTGEGDPIGRFRYRGKNAEDLLGFVFSSPVEEGDRIHQVEKEADCVYTPYLPCPHCGEMQPLFFFPGEKYLAEDGTKKPGGFVWFPSDESLDKYTRAEQARYKCGNCDALWTNQEKNSAMQQNQYRPDRKVEREGKKRFLYLWRIHEVRSAGSLYELVLEFLNCGKDKEKLQTFYNNALGLYWKDIAIEVDEKSVRASQIPYPENEVPESAVALIATVDVQKYGFWIIIRAWANDETSWKVHHTYCRSETELDYLLFETTWKFKGGRMGLWRIGIDIGGNEIDGEDLTATEWVYGWYLRNFRRGPTIFLCKGSSRRLSQTIKIGEPFFTLPSGKKIKKALRIISLDTNKTKSTFFWRISQANEETPICPAYVNVNEKEEYFKHLQAEHLVKDGQIKVWKRKGSQDNHLLDCEQMQIGISSRLLFGGVYMLRDPVGVIQQESNRRDYEDDEHEEDDAKFSQNTSFRRRRWLK